MQNTTNNRFWFASVFSVGVGGGGRIWENFGIVMMFHVDLGVQPANVFDRHAGELLAYGEVIKWEGKEKLQHGLENPLFLNTTV